MKISKREKILLTILLITAIVFLFYKFIFLKNKANLEALKNEYEQKNIQYEEMMEKIKQKNYYSAEYKKANFEVNEITKQFLPEIEQEKVIVFINKYILKNNIQAPSIGFTDVTFTSSVSNKEPTEEKDYLLRNLKNQIKNITVENQDTSKDEQTIEGASYEVMTMNLSYNAEYGDLLQFINNLQTNEINTNISNVNFIRNEDNTIQGTITMSLYSIPKLHDHENMEWVWNDLIAFGRSNPFYNDNSVNNFWTPRFDFTVNVKPISSDLPTVTLAKTNDTSRKTYIYADSNSIQNAYLYFKEENDKLYFKYNTETDKYPADDNWEEFTTENDFISLRIYSIERTSDEDMSGIKINVINDTDYIVYSYIVNDDILRPRVFFEDTSSVVINRD